MDLEGINVLLEDDCVPLTSRQLQRLYSHSYSAMILREAKRLLKKQRKEHAPLLRAARLKRQQGHSR